MDEWVDVDSDWEDIQPNNASSMLNTIKSIGKLAIKPLLSEERLSKIPGVQIAGDISPISNIPLPYGGEIPVPSMIVPPQFRRSLYNKTLSGMSSPAGILGTLGLLGGATSKAISRYPVEKVRAIQGGLRTAQKSATTEYGRMLRGLSKTGANEIDPTPVIGAIEKRLQDIGLLDPQLNKLRIPTNRVENGLLTSYQRLMSQFSQAQSGKIPAGNVITEARNVLSSAGKQSPSNRLYNFGRETHDFIIDNLRPQIRDDAFQAGQRAYGEFKNVFNPLSKIFKPYGGKFDTSKGERVLTDIYSQSGGTKELLNQIPQMTGQGITGAKVLSATSPLNILRRLLPRMRL